MKKRNQQDKVMKTFRSLPFILLFFYAVIAGTTSIANAGEMKLEVPLGLDASALHIPADNPMTTEKVALGRWLFFDKRLSRDNSIACSTCHMPALAFTDGQPVSTGISLLQGGRNAPSALNRAFTKTQFWDGRAPSLEAQAIGPLTNPVEHGFIDYDEMIAKLNKIEGYKKEFKKVFGTGISVDGVGKAIAAFERTFFSGNSPFDRFETGKDPKAISESAKRGLKLFRGKARCGICHSGFNFADEGFHNIGDGWDQASVDLGRYNVTKKTQDIGGFKTPTVREIEHTAPYMHSGSLHTLEEVVDFYNQGGIKNPFLSPLIMPLNLTDMEKKDLVAFMRALSGEGWQHIKSPDTFPQ